MYADSNLTVSPPYSPPPSSDRIHYIVFSNACWFRLHLCVMQKMWGTSCVCLTRTEMSAMLESAWGGLMHLLMHQTNQIFSPSRDRQTLMLASAVQSLLFRAPALKRHSLNVSQNDRRADFIIYMYYFISSPWGWLFYNLPWGDTPHPLHLCW